MQVLRYAAFPDGARGGNPAGVVLDAAGLTTEQMQAVARDVGYSETAFLVPAGRAGTYETRYFSPLAEVAFCGHATVAAAVALAERVGVGPRVLRTGIGRVAVATCDGPDGITATLTSVPTRTAAATAEQVDRTLRALRWDAAEVDPRYPVHVAYAGNDHLILGVTTRDRLARLDYDFPALAEVMADEGWTTVHLFWGETTTLFHARNPFPPGGVVEDPATGAAAAAFGGYLRAQHLVPAPGRFTILQGQDMGAPSRLLVDAEPGSACVRVTGTARPIPGTGAG